MFSLSNRHIKINNEISFKYAEATELESIYNGLGIHNELIPLMDQAHGPWNATVNGKSLSELSFDFIVERQNLTVE